MRACTGPGEYHTHCGSDTWRPTAAGTHRDGGAGFGRNASTGTSGGNATTSSAAARAGSQYPGLGRHDYGRNRVERGANCLGSAKSADDRAQAGPNGAPDCIETDCMRKLLTDLNQWMRKNS